MLGVTAGGGARAPQRRVACTFLVPSPTRGLVLCRLGGCQVPFAPVELLAKSSHIFELLLWAGTGPLAGGPAVTPGAACFFMGLTF